MALSTLVRYLKRWKYTSFHAVFDADFEYDNIIPKKFSFDGENWNLLAKF